MRGFNVKEVTNLSGQPRYTHLSNDKEMDWIVSIISKISYPQTLSLKSNYPFPFPGYLPNPGIRLRSPALQADSLSAEPQGKPKNAAVGSLSLFQ